MINDVSRPSQDNIKQVTPTYCLQWLARGWGDIWRCGAVSIAHGFIIAAFGGLLLLVAHDRFWLLAGAFSGFLVVAPVLATGLYALSRALEQGEPVGIPLLLETWTRWGEHRHRDPSSYWCLVRFGLLLALAGTGWVLTSAALITLLAPVPILGPVDFLRHIVVAPNSYVFELWLVLGGVLAAPMFASSVVSIPLLLDRRVSTLDAVLTSWRVVLDNPVSTAVWAAILMSLTLLGFATAMLGLIIIIPWLGHASWHAYRDLVNASNLPSRINEEKGGAET
jgi:uncharacterized membrane protein